MITEEYKTGFVEACLARNCNAEETEELFKLAAITHEFDDNEDFHSAFVQAAPHIDLTKVPLLAKAELVKNAGSVSIL